MLALSAVLLISGNALAVVATVTPERVVQGSFAVLRVRVPGASGAGTVEALGRRLPLFPAEGGLRALVPVSLKTKPGKHVLQIEVDQKQTTVELTVLARHTPAVQTLKKLTVTKKTGKSLRSSNQVLYQALRQVTPEALWSSPLRIPVPGRVTAKFGVPRRYGGGAGWTHKGLDLAMPEGSPVIAPTAGVVALSQWLGSYGNTIVLNHGQTVFTAYLHLHSMEVKKGQRVEAGQIIGAVGQTGMATGPHVHFAVYIHRVPVDPQEVLQRGLPSDD